MPPRKTFALLTVILALAATPAVAAEEQHDQHHPGGAPAAATPSPQGMGQGMPATGMAGMGGPGGMPMMDMMERGMGGMAMMAGHTEGRIAFLKAELTITDAQLPLWNAVAEAIRTNAKTGMGTMDGMGMAQGRKVPDRLAAREKMMAVQLEALRRFKSAVEPLYAVLSEEQKKAADQILMSPMGMM